VTACINARISRANATGKLIAHDAVVVAVVMASGPAMPFAVTGRRRPFA